jgi:hypothetical protein
VSLPILGMYHMSSINNNTFSNFRDHNYVALPILGMYHM